MPPRVLSEADEAEVLVRYQQGATYRQLAERFRCGVKTIGRVLERHGVQPRPGNLHVDVDTQAIVDLRRAGDTWAEIARAVGLAPTGCRHRYEAWQEGQKLRDENTPRVDPQLVGDQG